MANATVICCSVNEEGKEFYDTCNFRWFLNAGLNVINEHLFVRKTAGEILFDGYKDPILDAAEFIHKFNIPIPGIMDRFGFYYGRNGSDWWDGVFNMYTGKWSFFTLAKPRMSNWRGKHSTVAENIFLPFFTKQSAWLRRSTVLSFPLQLVFPGQVYTIVVDNNAIYGYYICYARSGKISVYSCQSYFTLFLQYLGVRPGPSTIKQFEELFCKLLSILFLNRSKCCINFLRNLHSVWNLCKRLFLFYFPFLA